MSAPKLAGLPTDVIEASLAVPLALSPLRSDNTAAAVLRAALRLVAELEAELAVVVRLPPSTTASVTAVPEPHFGPRQLIPAHYISAILSRAAEAPK